jgi:transposase
MITVGIDGGKRLHQACFLDVQGQALARPLRFATTAAGVRQLEERVRALGEPATVGLEASGHSWRGRYRRLTTAGWRVHVVNPMQADAVRATGVRTTKTARRAAEVSADLVRIGRARPSYVPDDIIVPRRDLTRCRWGVVDQGGATKRRRLAVLDRVFPEVAAQFTDPFAASGRALLAQAASAAEFASLDVGAVTATLERVSRTQFGQEKAEAVQQAAADSLGLASRGAAARLEVDALLAQLPLLEQQVAAADRAMATLLASLDQHRTTIPGIGPVLAATILAESGDVTRFPRVEALVASAGLDPGVCESGQVQGTRQPIATRGAPYLRRALFLAAHGAHARTPDLGASLARKRAEGKPYTVALLAVAHTLLARCYVVLTEGRPYDLR